MKRILIPLCLVVGSHMASGQRSYQFDAPNRLFVEGKELFSLKNFFLHTKIYISCFHFLESALENFSPIKKFSKIILEN